MFETFRDSPLSMAERLRSGLGRRSASLVLALLVEALLVLVMLTLDRMEPARKRPRTTEVTLSARSESESERPTPTKAADFKKAERPAPAAIQRQAAPNAQPVLPQPTPAAQPFIPLSRQQMAVLDIANLPSRPAGAAAPARAKMGPADTGSPADTQQVGGSGPNGETLYAASWYREPSDDELRGFLSTADGPGWALIACRTVPDFRVDDCIKLDEYPDRSNIARAVLAAAWQFRVRPPRLGGRVKVGEWVRIRIDYGIKRR